MKSAERFLRLIFSEMLDLLSCFDRVNALKLSTKKAIAQRRLELKDQFQGVCKRAPDGLKGLFHWTRYRLLQGSENFLK